MTTITRNLPWFIRDLGVSIVGQTCYTSLIENIDIHDVQCIKYSLSKGLGIGIVVGGSIMKIPQLILILSARSARGLSLPAYVLETLSYAITLAYAFRNDFPFSTYGENLFLAIQNTLITLLIINYPSLSVRRSQNTTRRLTTATTATLAAAIALYTVPSDILSLLQLSTLPLSVFSKLPQIRQNARAQSTGQLSAFAVISQILGCLARLFTTATEVGDVLLSTGFALALLLNIVLGTQLWMYWGKDFHEKEELGSGIASEKDGSWAQRQSQVDIVVPPQSVGGTVSSVPQPSGRKWARKVD